MSKGDGDGDDDEGTSYRTYLICVEFEDAVRQPAAALSLHAASRFVTRLFTLLVDSSRGGARSQARHLRVDDHLNWVWQ